MFWKYIFASLCFLAMVASFMLAAKALDKEQTELAVAWIIAAIFQLYAFARTVDDC